MRLAGVQILDALAHWLWSVQWLSIATLMAVVRDISAVTLSHLSEYSLTEVALALAAG
jgi:hypothetical protein